MDTPTDKTEFVHFASQLPDHVSNMVASFCEYEQIRIEHIASDYDFLKKVIQQGWRELAQELVKAGAQLNPDDGLIGDTPLYLAICNEDYDTVTLMLKNGARFEHLSSSFDSPMDEAIKLRNPHMVEILVTAVNNRLDNLVKPYESKIIPDVIHACISKDVAKFKELLDVGHSVDDQISALSPYWPMFTPLHIAVELNCYELVKVCLLRHANIFLRDSCGKTALHLAAIKNSNKICDLILKEQYKRKDYRNPKTTHGLSHFLIACQRNQAKLVREFVIRGVNVDSRVKKGSDTALHFAIDYRSANVSRTLIDLGADVSRPNDLGLSPVYEAMRTEQYTVVDKILLCAKPDLHYPKWDKWNFTLLHAACYRGQMLVVNTYCKLKKCIELAIDSNARKWPGYTPLHFAVESGKQEPVQKLIDCRVRVNEQDKSGNTPLHLAVKIQCLKTVELLIKSGADVNCRNSEDQTPLHIAAKLLNYDISKMLLLHGANVHATDRLGRTGIHFMSTQHRSAGHTNPMETDSTKLGKTYCEMITLFQEYGLEIDVRDNERKTALHLSCLTADTCCSVALLQNGADINAKDKTGSTPMTQRNVTHKRTDGLFLQHIGMLSSVGHYVCPENVKCFEELKAIHFSYLRAVVRLAPDAVEKRFDDFTKNCRDEIEDTKQIWIDNINLFEVLFKNEREMTYIVENENFVQFVNCQEFVERFPHIASLFTMRVKNSCIRRNFINTSNNVLNRLANQHLPDLVAEKICTYLSNEDMKNMLKSVHCAKDQLDNRQTEIDSMVFAMLSTNEYFFNCPFSTPRLLVAKVMPFIHKTE